MIRKIIKKIEVRGTEEVIERIKELDNLEFLYTVEKTRILPFIEEGFPKPNYIISVYLEDETIDCSVKS